MLALGVCFKQGSNRSPCHSAAQRQFQLKARIPREVLTKQSKAIASRIHARGVCGFAIGVGNMYSSSQPNRNLHQVVIASLHGTAMQSFPSPDPLSLCLFPIICKSSSSCVSSSVRPTPALIAEQCARPHHQCFAAAGSAAAPALPRELMPAADRDRTFSEPGAF